MRRHFLWLLVACYVLAVAWPAPGIAIRSWQWSSRQISNVPLASLLLLAVMLVIAAALADLEQLRNVWRHPFVVLIALVSVWLGPAALSLVLGHMLPPTIGGEPTLGLLVSFALIASMPVANSSVGWTQSAGGNLGLALALVVISILASPMITPNLVSVLGASLGESEQQCTELVSQFSGLFFIVWVILPTAAGFASRLLLSTARIEAVRPVLTLTSAAALLVLNYINSVLALPRVTSAPIAILATTFALATSLAAVGILLGWLIARAFGLRPETRTALMFGLSMKHTGLALILAGTVLSDQPVAILLIVLATLMQHILAGIVQWRMDRNLTAS
ncbi:MAG: bile acid:sodium symporter [Pirellulales bacterium]